MAFHNCCILCAILHDYSTKSAFLSKVDIKMSVSGTEERLIVKVNGLSLTRMLVSVRISVVGIFVISYIDIMQI